MNDRLQTGNPEEAPPLTGQAGRYQILDTLGRGAMGVVYRARDGVLQRDVALKVMAAPIAGDPELKARFEREARAAAQLSHPNVVTVFDLGYATDGSPYIAMELLTGHDLQRVVSDGLPLSLDRKLLVMVQVLLGLSHAHQAGIVHRDVKPGNIFLTDEGAAKILDFGMARLTRGSAGGTGSIMGTADYMSPEQVRGADLDGRSDVFSCGSILFELLTGRRPFHGDDLVTIVYRIVHEEPDYAPVSACEEHRALLPILQRALAKDVDKRYPGARELAADLEASIREDGLRRLVASAPEPLRLGAAGSAGAPVGEPTRDLRLQVTRPGPPDTAPDRRPQPRPALRWVLGAAGAAALAAAYLVLGRDAPGPRPRGAASSPQATAAPAPAVPPQSMAPSPVPRVVPLQEAPPGPVPSPFPSARAAETTPPANPATAAPSPPAASIAEHKAPSRVVAGRWRGYITDEFCRTKGGIADHWKCVETCMRKGRRPMLAVGDKLYWIAGLERIHGDRDKKVTVAGHLDTATGVLTVAGGH